MRKTILQEYCSCSLQKSAPKNTKYSRNETILKIGHLAKALAHAMTLAFENRQFRSKLKNAKNMQKTILQQYCSCSLQKKRSKKHHIFDK